MKKSNGFVAEMLFGALFGVSMFVMGAVFMINGATRYNNSRYENVVSPTQNILYIHPGE